ncbi:unnamed protein product [Zymoseptoria tritici ST99CH_3D7]|uniref:Uncharacterized protein n=3 Tax=Zymoseptoria tritici TaxID=1047171 RepID=A0A1X7RZS6_ZYMT9|nr:unnamed protein product [Zymoseptoria tritici ST99CH_3D7]
MEISWRNTLKKIEKAGGKLHGDVESPRALATLKSSGKKLNIEKEDPANEGDDGVPTTPDPKKLGRGKKAAVPLTSTRTTVEW